MMKTIQPCVALIAAATFILLAGCAARSGFSNADPRVMYDEAIRLIQKGKYTDAQTILQRMTLSFPGLSYIDSVQYQYGMTFYMNADYHLAVAEFRRLINSFPRSLLTDDAQLMIGESYFRAAPGHVGLDQTDTESAIRELKTFLEDNPGSDRRAEGEQILSAAIEKMVAKQFLAARQYYRMGNRDSARLYLEALITEYPESAYTPEALYMLARIDEKEDRFIEARDKLNNLLNAFPKSTVADDAAKLKAKLEAKIASRAETDSAAAAQLNDGKR